MAGLEEKLGAPLPADLETEDARAELDRLVRICGRPAQDTGLFLLPLLPEMVAHNLPLLGKATQVLGGPATKAMRICDGQLSHGCRRGV